VGKQSRAIVVARPAGRDRAARARRRASRDRASARRDRARDAARVRPARARSLEGVERRSPL